MDWETHIRKILERYTNRNRTTRAGKLIQKSLETCRLNHNGECEVHSNMGINYYTLDQACLLTWSYNKEYLTYTLLYDNQYGMMLHN